MSEGKRKLKFAILCQDTTFFAWQASAIEQLLDDGHQCVLLIREPANNESRSWINKLKNYPYRHAIYHEYQRFFFRPKAKIRRDLSERLAGVKQLICTTDKKGYSEYFRSADLEAIRASAPDFILRFAYNIIRGDILNVAPHGVWSFHHDDEKVYRGGPPGFWEIFYNNPVNGAMLQRLTNKLDGGIVLKKAWFATIKHSWSANMDHLFFESAIWPLQVCRAICNHQPEEKIYPTADGQAPIYKAPGNGMMLRFLMLQLFNKLKFHWCELLLAEKWSFGIIQTPIEKLIENPDDYSVQWAPALPRNRYWADSFAIEQETGIQVLFEDYDYRSRKGVISSIHWHPTNGFFNLQTGQIKRQCHLAYPYTFRYQDAVYCIPESAGDQKVVLYRQDATSGTFKEVSVLLDGVAAVDTSLFEYANRWWLFFSCKQNSNEQLHCAWSEAFEGPYQMHSNNPIKTDVRSARPGGMPFMYRGQLIRPAQNSSLTYGCQISLNCIERLTPDDFQERLIGSLKPLSGSPFNKGLHTLSVVGDQVVIDGKRWVFTWPNLIYQLKAKTGRLTRK